MPAKSKQQQKFMGIVHALNKGDVKPSDVTQSVRDVAKTIKKSDAKDFASTKHSGIPKKVKEQILKAFKEYANKMGGDKLGGSGSHGYAPQKGLRDDDGYDNMDERVSPKVLKALNLGLKKINRKFKGASLDGKTIDIELYSGHNRDSEIYQIYDLLKKLKLDKHKTSIFNDNVNYGDNEGPRDEGFASDAQRRAAFASGYKAKGKKGKKKMKEGMFSTLDQIRQDSKNVRDFVKNVFADRDFKKMKNDKEFIKYLKSIYEGVDESKGVPQNYMQGRVSDYHTALRGKKRDYSGGTNFKKTNHGQPDIENADEDEEVGLTNKQTPVNENEQYVAYAYKGNKVVKTVRDSKYNDKLFSKFKKDMERKGLKVNIDLLKNRKVVRQVYRTVNERLFVPSAFDKALDRMKFNQFTPNNIKKLSKKFKVDYKDAVEYIKQNKVINVAKKPSMAVNEVKVETERFFGKKGIIIMMRDGNKLISAIFKDKKNADKFNRNNPADVKKLYQLAKRTKFPKTIDEYGQRLDFSFIDDKEARLKGTPKPKDAINRDIDEYSTAGSYEFTKGDQFGQNSVTEVGVFPVTNYIKGIIPQGRLDTNTPENRKKSAKLVKDLRNTLNKFWKDHDIPFKIR
tara:strand:+ start:1696 stop:3570 length:1875 start_codon:yes stop_codon:yes gene_type:complete